ncbi:hypothetical protein HHX47_DHR2000080 [Lentinula edodes]|nr:hypothetical protein HHX47_DHR2000080 [Lentinula edodes]
MDSPRSRNHSPSSLNLKREEEKEKRAAEEQKEAEGRARKLAQEKARTVAAKQAQREKEEKARKPAVEEAQREVKKSKRCMLEERKRVEEQLLEEEETEKQQDDERKKNEAQDMERGRQASSIWGTLIDVWEMRWQQVVSSSGEEVFFKIKRVTPLRKLLVAYATKVGKEPHTIRFLYDGARINDSDTPESLEMEDNDTIDVMVEQVGGYFS